MQATDKRKSNIELLRIVVMFLIVGHHYFIHGLVDSWDQEGCQIWLRGGKSTDLSQACFFPGGEVGVAVFFIIMGFFSIRKDKIRATRVIVQTEYCAIISIAMLVIMSIAGIHIGFATLLNSVIKLIAIPVSGMWWYVPVYLLICFIAPLVNGIIRPLRKKTMIILLVLMWGLWYGLGNLCTAPLYVLQKGIFFYTIGAFLQLHRKTEEKHFYRGVILVGLWLLGVACAWLSCKASVSAGPESMQFRMIAFFYSTFIVPGCAIELFNIFNDMKVQNDRINQIAKTTFGIYLLHDSVPARIIVWDKLLQVKAQYQTQWFPAYMIASILIIYCIFGIVMHMWNIYAEEKVLKKLKKAAQTIKERENLYEHNI